MGCQSGSGAATLKANSYNVQNPRTVFYLPRDDKVVVACEWSAPQPGPHHVSALWKNQQNGVTIASDLGVTTDSRCRTCVFGAYFSLALSNKSPAGVWTLEAHVDDDLASRAVESVEVVPASTPPPTAAVTVVRTPLSDAQLYKLALASTITVENSQSSGDVLRSLGFFIGKGLVLTAFQAIDGAQSLRVKLSSGRGLEVQSIVAFNRRDDWAILRVPYASAPALQLANPGSWAIGDKAFFLDAAPAGGRVIYPTQIIGENSSSAAGARINLEMSATREGVGAPLLDEYGGVIGVMGGSLLPGVASLDAVRYGDPGNLTAARELYRGAMATSMDSVSAAIAGAANAPGTALQQMWSTGAFLPPLVARDEVAIGALARKVVDEDGVFRAEDEKFDYPRGGGPAFVLLGLTPHHMRTATGVLVVYDLDNRVVLRNSPVAFHLRPNRFFYWNEPLDVSRLDPGIYRVDITLDGSPVWRTFFRVSQ